MPLMNAVDNGDAQMVRILLEAGADPHRHKVKDVDEEGDVIEIGTLGDFAETCGDAEVLALVG